MSNDNLFNGGDNNPLGMPEKKIILKMIATFKRTNNDSGLRDFLGRKMNLNVQEIEETMSNIDHNLPAINNITL